MLMYEYVVIFLGLIVPPPFSGDSSKRLVNLPGGAPNHADTPPRLLPRSQVMTVACNLQVVTRGLVGLRVRSSGALSSGGGHRGARVPTLRDGWYYVTRWLPLLVVKSD